MNPWGLTDRRPELGRFRDWFLGFSLLGALVVLLSQTLGWASLSAPWQTLSWKQLLPAILLITLSALLRAVRVYDALHPRLNGAFPAVVRLSILHNGANNLLPMRLGELAFPWLLHRNFGQGFGDALIALGWIRLLDLHFLGLMGLLALGLRTPDPLWGLVALAWLGTLLLVPRGARWRFLKRARLLARLLDAVPQSPARLLRLYGWTALSWSLKFLAFVLILGHFLPIAIWQRMFGVLGAELSSVLPVHGVAGAGSYEFATVAALLPFGVEPEAALAGAVNLHLFVLGMSLILGALAFLLPRRPPASVS